MRVFRQLQNSLIFVEGVGQFPREGLSFNSQGTTDIQCFSNGVEVFDEAWADITDEDDVSAGASQAAVLTYLNDQLIAIQVSGAWANSDTTTNLNTGTSFTAQFVPIVSNEAKASDLFTRINDDVFQTEFFGEILIAVNIHLTAAADRVALQSRLVRDPLGTPTVEGPIGSSGYIRNLTGHNESSIHLTHVTGVDVGHRFAVGIRRESTPTANCTMRFANTSHIQIVRVR